MFINAKCYSNEIMRSFFLGGGGKGRWEGIQIYYNVCVCHTAMICFLLNFFFWGGRGGWGPFFQISSLILYLLRSRFDLFHKGPPSRELLSNNHLYRHKELPMSIRSQINRSCDGNSRTLIQNKRSLCKFIHIFNHILPFLPFHYF